MKKAIPFLMVPLLIAMTLIGCGREKAPSGNRLDDKPSAVATIFAPYDFARAIADDKAEITMLLSPGSETHSFEPTPQDIIKIQNCDVFIYVGGESDKWVDGILESMDTSKMKIITLMDCVEVVEEELIEGMEEEESGEGYGEEEPEYDEHVWTSPRNAKLIVQKISDAFCEVDADNADIYKANTTAYLTKLDDLDANFQNIADNSARKTIVFGDRFPFRYFADTYGLEYFAAFPGCSTETEPSSKTIAFLIDKIKQENIPVVFHVELGNENMATSISEATGAKSLLLHACHNISKNDFTGGATYLSLMTQNIVALKEALK